MPRWPSVDIDRTRVIRVDDISDKGNYSYLLHMGSDTWKTLSFPAELLNCITIIFWQKITKWANFKKSFAYIVFPFVHMNVLNISNLRFRSDYF